MKVIKGLELHMEQVYKKITVDDLKNIDDTWDITQPMYWTVDIYGSYEEYLKLAEAFILEQRYLLATIWYFLEVNNGRVIFCRILPAFGGLCLKWNIDSEVHTHTQPHPRPMACKNASSAS